MICTLRNWEQRRRLSLTSPLGPRAKGHDADGPELLLTPELSIRDVSPMRHPGKSPRPLEPPVPFSIPISDILVVETYNVRYGAAIHKLTVTTKSFGVFELNCDGINGHDILLAFLHASLPAERILDGGGACIRPSESNVSCLDIDGFTARKVYERGENETWPEKLSRRVGKVVNSLHEMSITLCDVSCCQQIHTELSSSRHDAERRDPPAVRFNELGLEEEESSLTSPLAQKESSVGSLKQGPPKWQYGLSMESDPELEYTR